MKQNANKLPIFGHLAELRSRVIRSVIAVGITVTIAFIFYEQLFRILIFPAEGIRLIFTEVTEMLGTTMKVSLTGGLILAIPYLTFELIMFISPALTKQERKYLFLILPWMTLMFAAGVLFAYYVMLPPMLEFMLTFGGKIAEPQIKIGSYISLVTRLLLVFGLIFETPVVTTFLARIGILKGEWLAKRRRMAILVAFILSAMITPTIDPINQAIVAAPLIVLYEMSIWLAKLVQKRKKQAG